MNSRVSSSVHIMTANTPSTKVQCHRVPKAAAFSKEPVKCSSSTTNEFLKKGGTLPPVLPLPHTEHTESTLDFLRSNKKLSASRRRTITVTHNKNLQCLGTEGRESEKHNDHLEKKMEHLNDKLSKVQDILFGQIKDYLEDIQSKNDQTDGFSAHDYAFLILEMNGSVPSEPYDPGEFSEQTDSGVQCDGQQTHISEAPTTAMGKAEVLQAIQDDLMNWRAEQRQHVQDFIPA